MSSFMDALKKDIFYFICKHKLIQIISTFLLSILQFNSFAATLFFLVIISIPLSHSLYFNLFPPYFFLNIQRGTLMKNTPFGAFLGYSHHLRSSVIVVGVCSNIFYIINVIIFIITVFNELAYFFNSWQQIKYILPYI